MKLIHFNGDYAVTFWKWYHDPRLKSFFRGYEQGASFAQCANAPAWMRASLLLGFEDDAFKAPVGMITFAESDPILRVYKMGILTDPDTQHKGCGKQILELGMEWAFITMNAHKVFAKMLKSDLRILKGANNYGLIREGTDRESCYLSGEYLDQEVYSILKSEYTRRPHVTARNDE